MAKLDGRLPEVRIEVVTTTFVASGQPDGIHDLGRFLENLNNPVASRHIELRSPAIRPLYRAQTHVSLDAPLLVRRGRSSSPTSTARTTHGVVRNRTRPRRC
jgi:hypothetical protein